MSPRRIRPVVALAGAASLAFALTACGSSGSDDVNAESGDSSATTSTSPTASPSSAGVGPSVGRCATKDVKGRVRELGGAAGTAYYAIRLTNTGSGPCTISGFGGVSLIGDGDQQIGAPARRDTTEGPAKVVVLTPGGSAVQRLGVGTAVNYPKARCHPTDASALRVYPPDQTASLRIPIKVTGCASTSVKLLTVQPYARG